MTEPSVNAFVARTEADQQETTFGQLMRENQRRVLQIAHSVLGNSADAEEVAQEAFLRAYQKFQSLRDPQRFRAWVNRISFRLALNRQRGSKRRMVRDTVWHDSAVEIVDGTKNAEDYMLAERLRQQIEQLPEKLRSVLQLSIVEEMDATDTAAVLGIPPGTVRSRLHTARKLLLEAMQ